MKSKIIIEIETEGFNPLYAYKEDKEYDEDGKLNEIDYDTPYFTEQDFHDKILSFIQSKFGRGELPEYFDFDMPEEWSSINEFASKLTIRINGKEIPKKEID